MRFGITLFVVIFISRWSLIVQGLKHVFFNPVRFGGVRVAFNQRGVCTKSQYSCTEIIVENIYLPPTPSHHNDHGLACTGGVVLPSQDENIVCENTFDARLDIAFRKKLPQVIKCLCSPICCLIHIGVS